MKLLLDEMYPTALAEQLRARGYDAVSIHDAEYCRLAGRPDADVFAAALSEERVVVTEDIARFLQLEAAMLAQAGASPGPIFTTNHRFPRSNPATLGRLVRALDALLERDPLLTSSLFLTDPPLG